MVKIVIIKHYIKYIIISLFSVIVILWLILNVTSKNYENEDLLLRINDKDINQEENYSDIKWWYIDYDENLIKNFDWRIILEFYANWCSTCKSFDKSLEDYDLPENILILKIDFDNSEELRKKYAVLTQSTFVEINNREEVLNRFIGIINIEDLVEKLKEEK